MKLRRARQPSEPLGLPLSPGLPSSEPRPKENRMAIEQNASQDKLAETRATFAEEQALRARLRELCSEDDFAGGLTVLERYPKLTTREFTEFERDLRDWGFAYGLAFGLAIEAWPEEPHAEVARRVLTAALSVYREWGGEI